MYPAQLVIPMKQELTHVGFEDLISADQVDKTIKSKGTVLVVINSVCGCAAGTARPGVRLSLENEKKPNRLTTVFAGFDMESTEQVRKHLLPYPPSSPSIALFKDGKLVYFLERHQIQGQAAEMLAQKLTLAYDTYC